MIAAVDEFILFDDVQYTRRDWRNRNLIKTPAGEKWLTIPVRSKGNYKQKINQVEIDGSDWAKQHWKTIIQNYRRAPFFNEVATIFATLYESESPHMLSELNSRLIRMICRYLGITTRVSHSSDYILHEGKNERLVELCKQAGASVYVSGPAAKAYLDKDVFNAVGVSVSWFNYSDYPEYPQLWGGFVHRVSILDLLFNCGPKSHSFMKFVKP